MISTIEYLQKTFENCHFILLQGKREILKLQFFTQILLIDRLFSML